MQGVLPVCDAGVLLVSLRCVSSRRALASVCSSTRHSFFFFSGRGLYSLVEGKKINVNGPFFISFAQLVSSKTTRPTTTAFGFPPSPNTDPFFKSPVPVPIPPLFLLPRGPHLVLPRHTTLLFPLLPRRTITRARSSSLELWSPCASKPAPKTLWQPITPLRTSRQTSTYIWLACISNDVAKRLPTCELRSRRFAQTSCSFSGEEEGSSCTGGPRGVASASKAKAGDPTKQSFGCLYQGFDIRATRYEPLFPCL
jgi:hypothetical protein